FSRLLGGEPLRRAIALPAAAAALGRHNRRREIVRLHLLGEKRPVLGPLRLRAREILLPRGLFLGGEGGDALCRERQRGRIGADGGGVEQRGPADGGEKGNANEE